MPSKLAQSESSLVVQEETTSPLAAGVEGTGSPEPVVRAFSEQAYLQPIAQVTPRICLTVGATWGASFFIFMSLLDPARLLSLAGASFLGGGLFGLVWGGWFCWYVRVFNRRLLARPQDHFDPAQVARVKAEDPQLEILGNMRHHHAAIGGALVLTRTSLWFLPHTHNHKSYREPVCIALADVQDLEVVARSRLEMWFTGDRKDLFPGRLKVTSSRGAWEFNVGTRPMLVTLVERMGPLLPLAAEVDRLLASPNPDEDGPPPVDAVAA